MRFNEFFQGVVRFQPDEVSHFPLLAIAIELWLGKGCVPTEPELLEVLPVSLQDT